MLKRFLPPGHQQIPRSLYGCMLLQFSIGGALIPFVSLFLHDRGLDFTQISRIYLAASATLLIFPFLWGMLADRFIPINHLFGGLNLLAFGALLSLSQQDSFMGLLVSFVCFYACFNPTLLMINALSFHYLPQPTQQFGALRAWGSVGWILPSLPIFLWLMKAPESDLSGVLFLSMGLCCGAILVTAFLPRVQPGAKTSATTALPKLGYWPSVKRLMRDANYLTLLVAFFLMAGSFSIFVFYSPPFLEQAGIGRAWIGPIQCIGVVFEVMLFPWLPVFFRRWRYTATILIGCLALVGRQLLFASTMAPWLLVASYLLAGMVIVFFHIGASILANTIAGVEVRATAQTLLIFFGSGLGPMFSNGIAGFLTGPSDDQLQPVFLFAAALAALAGALVFARRSQLNQAGLDS